MNTILICRKLLQSSDVDSADDGIDPYASITAAVRRPFDTTAPFNSSMALTILVLLTVLFFLVFFSIYIRRFATVADELPPPPPSSDPNRRPPPSNRKGGLDAAAVHSLPLVPYGGGAAERHHRQPTIDDCPICLSEFRERETVKLIPYCGHVFHPVCIDTWLASHVTCPLCRSAQLFKSVEEVCLDVTHDHDDIRASDVGQRSTVGSGDTWRMEGSEAAAATCTCSNSSNRAVMERSTSF